MTVSRLTPQVRDEIVRRLASGVPLEVAAQAAGVHRVTVQTWLRVGREAEEKADAGRKLTPRERDCLDMLIKERAARADVRVKALASIQKAALGGTWQAAAWLLERMFPDEYAAQKRTNGGAGGRPRGAVSAPDRAKKPKLRVVGE